MASSIRSKTSFFSKKTIVTIILTTLFLVLPLFVSIYEVVNSRLPEDISKASSNINLTPQDTDIKAIFASYDYDLKEIRKGYTPVPKLFLSSLPDDLDQISNTNERKKIFISIILPLILQVNENIMKDRRQLSEIMFSMETTREMDNQERTWINKKLKEYRIQTFDLPELYSRMNIIPPSLAISQAAIETGWGTSRFATEANALYGQWTWDDEKGMVPLKRRDDQSHSIKVFDDLMSAVRGYALNLNTHPVYEDFRIERRKYKNPREIDVGDLLITLIFYSELGYEYIDNLNSIIRVNRLRQFDAAKLSENMFQEARLNQAL